MLRINNEKNIHCNRGCIVFVCGCASGRSTAVLKVTGVLTNDACTPELDGGGVVDFGTKYINELSATETNQLGHKDLFQNFLHCPNQSWLSNQRRSC